MRTRTIALWMLLVPAVIILQGCKDLGENPPPPPIVPHIAVISVDTIGVGGELVLLGTGFEEYRPTSAVVFSNNVVGTTYAEWTDSRIRVVVPDGAVSGPVRVRKGNVVSNALTLTVATIVPPGGPLTFGQPTITLLETQSGSVFLSGGTAPYAIQSGPNNAVATVTLNARSVTVLGIAAGSTSVTVVDVSTPPKTAPLTIQVNPRPTGISFVLQVIPIFSANCTGCHGGTAGMFLSPGEAYANLVNVPAKTGTCVGTPRVTPGNSNASALYFRISGTCSERMPLGGQLPAADIEVIRQWIDQGAANN